MKRITLFLLSMVLLLQLTACGGNPSPNESTGGSDPANQETATDGSVLRIGCTIDHTTFNLFDQGGAYGKLNLERFGQQPLVGMDENGELTPGFFETFEINDANDTVVFTFPTDAKFHDGTTITLEDVLFSMESWMDKWKGRGYNVTVTDSAEGTITCQLDTPSAYAWLSYGAGQCYIAPYHVWEKVEGDYSSYVGEDAHIGAGPYRFVSYDEAAQVSCYEAFEDYYWGEQTIEKVELHSYSSPENLVMAIKNGEIDAMYTYASPIASTLIGTLEGAEDVETGGSNYSGNYQLTFGFNAYPTNEQSFREAVYYALDYDLLATTIGGNEAVPAHRGMIPQGNKGYVDGYPVNERDLEEAGRILDEAGYLDVDGDGIRDDQNGQPMTVSILPQSGKNGMMSRLAEVIMNNLADVGIQCAMDEDAMRNKDIFNQRTKVDKNYQLYVGYTTPGVADYRTSAFYILPEPYYQSGTFDDSDYVAAYQALQNAKNTEEYGIAAAEIQAINAEKFPLIALAWEQAYFPYRTDRFAGWENWPSTGVINQDTWFQVTLQ